MAEKKEHTVVGLNRSTIATIMLVVGVAGALAVWKDRGGAEAKAAVLHDVRVDGHESRLINVETAVVKVKENHNEFKEETLQRFNTNEKATLRVELNQVALLKGQTAAEIRRKEDANLAREQRKEDTKAIQRLAETVAASTAYLKTIETIEGALGTTRVAVAALEHPTELQAFKLKT